MVMLPNYIERLNEGIKLFDVNNAIKKVHKHHREHILNQIRKDNIHISTYYYWLNGKSPFPIKYILLFSKLEPNLLDEIYKSMNLASVGERKSKLPKILNEELAYLIGVIHGDGSLHKNRKYVSITTESYSYLNEIVNPIFKRIFEIQGNIRKCDINCNRLEVGSKVIHSFISLFCPVGKKKGSLRIPMLLFENDNLLSSYLSGFFDTDGCLTCMEKGKRKQLYFSFMQADKRIVYEIYYALKKLKIEINEPKPTYVCSHPYSKNRDLTEWRIYIGSKKVLKNFLSKIKFYHPLKKQRADIISRLIK